MDGEQDKPKKGIQGRLRFVHWTGCPCLWLISNCALMSFYSIWSSCASFSECFCLSVVLMRPGKLPLFPWPVTSSIPCILCLLQYPRNCCTLSMSNTMRAGGKLHSRILIQCYIFCKKALSSNKGEARSILVCPTEIQLPGNENSQKNSGSLCYCCVKQGRSVLR